MEMAGLAAVRNSTHRATQPAPLWLDGPRGDSVCGSHRRWLMDITNPETTTRLLDDVLEDLAVGRAAAHDRGRPAVPRPGDRSRAPRFLERALS
jgi:hypothetical protein